MRAFLLTVMLLWLSAGAAGATKRYRTTVISLPGEVWWGGMVGLGSHMPFSSRIRMYDLGSENANNQNVPLLLSSHGRYVWSDSAFTFGFDGNNILLSSRHKKLSVSSGGSTLREAFLAASAQHFPPAGTLPDTLFFLMPQYNTWIELMYNQNQTDILAYADRILANGFPPGVFMVDDNWQQYYGNFEFKPSRFADPLAMTSRLHRQGFRVMLWVCPFVSPDSPEFRYLQQQGFLVRRKEEGQPTAIIPWWNGYSACYDLTHPAATRHLIEQLRNLQEKYHIDGFKFDAGDIHHYADRHLSFFDSLATAPEVSRHWAEIGLHFPFNEYRAGWKMGGQPLVQRLGDKDYSWQAVAQLIPEMLTAGLLGYAYACPDMIGGGQFASFLGIRPEDIDQDLIVRSCQVHALMPMMQFSVAPWRILSAHRLAICREAALLHCRMGPYILDMARHAARSGEPIVRHMEYAFPQQGFERCTDQFMLGSRYLVAPMVTKGYEREVKLPRGTWEDETGQRFRGPAVIRIDVPLSRLPYFQKVDD